MARQTEARVYSVDPHKIYNGPKVQFTSREQFRDMAACLKMLEEDKKYHKFGIVGIIPPHGAAPPVLDVLNEGAAGLGPIRYKSATTSYADQRMYRMARHMNIVENDVVTAQHTFEEFVEFAKLAEKFEPYDRNVEEALRLHWKKHARVTVTKDQVRKGEAEKPEPRPYPFTIDGSLFKILMEEQHDVSEKIPFFNSFL